MLDSIIPSLFMVIALLFSSNLINLYRKYRSGYGKINHLSLMATISLIVMFGFLALYFVSFNKVIILIAQLYLILSMLYIRYSSKKNEDN